MPLPNSKAGDELGSVPNSKELKYVGPDYKICMITPDGRKALPREWDQKQIQDALLRWPNLAEWFK
jgi:hypothetical protein